MLSTKTNCKILSAGCKFCKLKCCFSCTFSSSAATEGGLKSGHCKTKLAIKTCEQCFLCRSIVFGQTCIKCPTYCTKSACRGQYWETWKPWGSANSSANVERRVHLTLPNQTLSYHVTDNHQLLCTSSQEPLPGRGIASADEQNAVELVKNQESLGFYNWLFLVPKPNNKWRPKRSN